MRSRRPILLIEDDDLDAEAVRRALQELRVTNALVRVRHGEEALGHLRDGACERPGMILLDLRMPRMGGLEFLTALKADDELRRLPVIILTTSGEAHDVLASFHLGVQGYMVKPMGYQPFVEMMRTIVQYWTLSELPEAS